jgi:hypothetical protein
MVVFNSRKSLGAFISTFLATFANGQVSPEFYPSPWTNGSLDWDAAYEKAVAFVSQLTLLEKVNLTTGAGYVIFALS